MNLWHILFLLLVILFFLKSQYLVYDRDKLALESKLVFLKSLDFYGINSLKVMLFMESIPKKCCFIWIFQRKYVLYVKKLSPLGWLN